MRWLGWRWAILVGLVVVSAFRVAADRPHPIARFLSPRLHIGEVFQGQLLEHRFDVVNEGSADLVIERSAASCGATTHQPGVVAPGQTGAIEVRYDTSHDVGKIELRTDVWTNDRLRRLTTLVVTMDVVPELTADVDLMDVGRLRRNSPIAATLVIRRHNRRADVLDVRSTAEDIRVRTERTGDRVLLHLSGSARSSAGVFGNLIVRTSQAHLAELRIPVRGFVSTAQ